MTTDRTVYRPDVDVGPDKGDADQVASEALAPEQASSTGLIADKGSAGATRPVEVAGTGAKGLAADGIIPSVEQPEAEANVANPAGRSRGSDTQAGAAQPPTVSDPEPYRVSLPEFEGPLDLLLHLCKVHEIDIVDIQISFITRKYLEYLDLMRELSVEVAAEYLVMAATLAYLKSRELLPDVEEEEVAALGEAEDVEDPKEALIRRLLEYQKYKDAADKLAQQPVEGKTVFGRGVAIETTGEARPLAEHSPWKLIEAFARILKDARPAPTHRVEVERLSITERIGQLVDAFETEDGTVAFEKLFDRDQPSDLLRQQLVVTLLAVLELTRLKAVRVLQDAETDVFYIARVEGVSLEKFRGVRTTSDDSNSSTGEPVETMASDEMASNETQTNAHESGGATCPLGRPSPRLVPMQRPSPSQRMADEPG